MSATTWAVVAGLGVYHGLNPAMGWLFAVALGLQEQRWSAVLRAVPPIAAGHALSIATVVIVVGWAGAFIPTWALQYAGAAVLLGFALYLLTRRARHKMRVGMRAGPRDLTLWSFIMASAHGSGLMLLPVLLRRDSVAVSHAAHLHAGSADPLTGDGLLVIAVHTAAMLTALTAVALLSYKMLGLAFLRRAWLNLDLIWIAALVLAAAATLVTA